MSLSDWHLAVKLADQPLAPKSILRLPETELGEYSLGGYSISFLKQLIAGKLQESVPDPELIDLIYCGRKLKDDQTLDFYGIQPGSTVHVLRKSWPEPDQKPEPVDKVAALREFRVLHTALHSSSSYREAVFKMLGNKESLDQIIVATPGLSSDPIALGVLQDKDLFSVFADPNMLDTKENSSTLGREGTCQRLPREVVMELRPETDRRASLAVHVPSCLVEGKVKYLKWIPGLKALPLLLGASSRRTKPTGESLVPAHPALVNAIILVLHSVAGSTPLPGADSSSRSMPSSSYRDMPGGFLFEGLSDDEDDFHPSARSTPSSSTPSSRPASLGYSGAAGPRPITQSELATALALASTPESSSHTPTPGTQGHSSGTSPMSSGVQSGTPITNDLFSQALQHALQASGQPSLQSQWQPQLQQLRDMGIQDDELSLRALQATGGDIQAALELIFAGGAP
ncbi:ubiquitin-like protein 7 isoform X1 [Diceros bicornis minor]|uniref:ubiquitin-like protein 7 isoform X1 n=1 Tax=Diceros bicornis minor TaxID=77932 RepID=UPI0026EFE95D|nr:ubiquitin-like protein 7 isoform X1 [Diceros bicornis minor]XP_058398046.1 ubiquitin-like protein 7 isoform X1 [Diceros bicornis minor]